MGHLTKYPIVKVKPYVLDNDIHVNPILQYY
jgi:hypothetical protein